MAHTFHLTVARVGENLFDGEALSITLPGKEGVFTVLANHEPFVSELSEGEAHIVDADNQRKTIHIHDKGIAEISKNQATILL